MALLAEAIRASDQQIARYRAADGYTVEVQRITGPETPYVQESYAVRIRRGDEAAQNLHDANDLVEALAYLHQLSTPGFAPDSTDWEPA